MVGLAAREVRRNSATRHRGNLGRKFQASSPMLFRPNYSVYTHTYYPAMRLRGWLGEAQLRGLDNNTAPPN